MSDSRHHKNAPSSSYPVRVYLGLGSNLGDRDANLREAIGRIKGLGLEVARESSVYETEPVGYLDQPWFLNQVIEVLLADESSFREPLEGQSSILTAQLEGMLAALLDIEREMGRRRLVRNGPRVIDIDLLIYAGMKEPFEAAGGRLIVPHPRMHLRRFVLEPLCEIAPDLVHPATNLNCREMLAALHE